MREPVTPLGATVTAAGRYGYPGFLLGLATNQISLSYWDYQLRLDGGTPRNGWTVFVFGANDELDTRGRRPPIPNDPNPPLAPSLVLGFHRVDLRLHRTPRRARGDVRAGARLRPHLQHGDRLPRLERRADRDRALGADAELTSRPRRAGSGLSQGRAGRRRGRGDRTRSRRITAPLDKFYVVSSYLEALWRPTPRIADPPRRPRRHLRRRHDHQVARRSAPDGALQARSSATCPTCRPAATTARCGSRRAPASITSRRASCCRCPAST